MRRIKYVLFTVVFMSGILLGGCTNEKDSTTEVVSTRKGWNEEQTIYKNSYGVTVTKNELEYLKTEILTPLESEEDLDIFVEREYMESLFPVFLNYEGTLYKGILEDRVVLLPKEAKEVGTVKAIRDDQDFVYTKMDSFEVSKNAVKLGIAPNSPIYQNQDRKELLYVEAKEKDGYFIFVQKDTEFKGEWNKEHTIYTNANFVEIPKEVYDEIGTQVEQKGKKLEKYINFFYQCDIDWYLPVDIRYQGNLYRMYLFQDMNNNYYKKSQKYGTDQEFLDGIKEVAQIKAVVGDNKRRDVQELEITANVSNILADIKEGTLIYQNENNPEVLLLKNNQLTSMGSLLEEEFTQEYFYFFRIKEK